MNKGFSNMDYYNYGNQLNPQFPQMQLQQPQAQQCPCNMLIYSQGKEAAKAYPMAPERTGFFLDDQGPYLYRKTTDKYGRTVEFKSFRLEEEPEEEIVSPASNIVTKDEFDKFTNDINGSIQNLMKSMLDLQNSINKPKHYNNSNQGKKVNGNVQ